MTDTNAQAAKAKTQTELTCTDCSQLNCYRRDKNFPAFCLTTDSGKNSDGQTSEYNAAQAVYLAEGPERAMALAAAEIEGQFYGRLTRVEEIIEFAKKIHVKKIGIATCVGLIEEAKIFARILKVRGLDSYSVICKVGSTDKTDIGVPETAKVQPGCFEAMCNPVLQAKLLNRQQTDLNVIVGLCVGHDSLFIKHSQAPVTTLITKDRVLGHNPAAALYTSNFYYKKLLQEEK